jgi:hypothetical protein
VLVCALVLVLCVCVCDVYALVFVLCVCGKYTTNKNVYKKNLVEPNLI